MRLLKKILLKNKYLYIVFLTGASVLILEVLATRLLSVYFGNTIFTVSSVISIMLLALSLGYFAGGKFADKKADESILFRIILISGYSVLAIYLMNIFLIPELSYALTMREGPLLIAFVLFFLPALTLGMLSPIVVVLQNRRQKEGIGKTTGDVFFWSTLGSIAGSLICGYYLIPNFGLDYILVGVGIFLIILSSIGLWKQINKLFIAMLFVFSFLGISLIISVLINTSGIVNDRSIKYAKDGVYSKIVIYDGIYSGLPARFLRQDLDRSSAIYLDIPDHIFEYTKYYALYKMQNSNIKNALVIGGGAYIVPKSLINDNPEVIVDVAEIEPELFDVIKKYFDLPADPRLANHVTDGRRFLYETKKKYGLIFADAYNFSVPSHMSTLEFLELCKAKLTNDGIFVMNIVGSLKDEVPSYALSQLKTFKKVFPDNLFFAIDPYHLEKKQNLIYVGFKNPPFFSAYELQHSKDNFLKWISINIVNDDSFDLRKHKIFTDNYAPVDYYISLSL